MLRHIIITSLLFFCGSAFSAPFDPLLNEIKGGNTSLSTISILVSLDNPEYKTGYGLCMASGRQGCASSGSIGYGLCMASGRQGCKSRGSVGYGLCMAAGRQGCASRGSVGYGLCMAAGRQGCASN